MLIKTPSCTVLMTPSEIPVSASYLPLLSRGVSYKVKKYHGEQFKGMLLNY